MEADDKLCKFYSKKNGICIGEESSNTQEDSQVCFCITPKNETPSWILGICLFRLNVRWIFCVSVWFAYLLFSQKMATDTLLLGILHLICWRRILGFAGFIVLFGNIESVCVYSFKVLSNIGRKRKLFIGFWTICKN